MIKSLIVDDDDICRMEVEQMAKNVPYLKVSASMRNAMEAFNFIAENNPDLVFLDVMMPEVSGLELVQCLNGHKPEIILMTTEKYFAADAFNYNVTDFLAKPISEERFLTAVSKVKKHLDARAPQAGSTQTFVKVKSKLEKIRTDDILYIEFKEVHSYIHTCTATYEVSKTLRDLQATLAERNFMRVHNSYIVNLNKISSIEGSSLIINKSIVPVSQVHFKELMSNLNLLGKIQRVEV